MTHQPTVTKNYKNTQSEFDPNLGSCDVSVAPRAVRLSTSPGTQLLLLLKGNSDVPFFFHFLNYPLRMQAFQKLQPGSTIDAFSFFLCCMFENDCLSFGLFYLTVQTKATRLILKSCQRVCVPISSLNG